MNKINTTFNTRCNINLLSNKSLLAFHLAAKERSFTKAAVKLNIGQPAISHAVRQLEGLLDTTLFKRLHNGVELTTDGELLAHHLDRGFSEIQTGLEAVLQKSQQQITLFISTALASHWLMPRIARFKHSYPDIQLRCITQDTDNEVQKGNFDLCIPLGQVSWEGFQRAKFHEELITIVCSPEYLEKHTKLNEVSDLPNHALIHLEERYTSRLDWRRLFDNFDLDYRNSNADETFNDYSIVLQAATEGQGVALGWKPLVNSLIKEGKLVAPLELEIKTENPFYILTPKDKVNDKSTQLLKDWLLDEMKESVKGV
ncbi:MAG: LysR substrate-binding domain-containing protein [Cocleimonas sp.]